MCLQIGRPVSEPLPDPILPKADAPKSDARTVPTTADSTKPDRTKPASSKSESGKGSVTNKTVKTPIRSGFDDTPAKEEADDDEGFGSARRKPLSVSRKDQTPSNARTKESKRDVSNPGSQSTSESRPSVARNLEPDADTKDATKSASKSVVEDSSTKPSLSKTSGKGKSKPSRERKTAKKKDLDPVTAWYFLVLQVRNHAENTDRWFYYIVHGKAAAEREVANFKRSFTNPYATKLDVNYFLFENEEEAKKGCEMYKINKEKWLQEQRRLGNYQ